MRVDLEKSNCYIVIVDKYVENSEDLGELKIFALLNYLGTLKQKFNKATFLSYSNEIFNEIFFKERLLQKT